MKYEIKGGAFPVVVCELENGEQMITEKGSMVWMSPNMQMDTAGGGLGKMFSKAFSGESMFQNIYTAQGAGMIAFGSSFPGRILPLEIRPGREMIVQKSAFLASEAGIQLSIHFNKKMGAGFFGGEGFIMQRLSGSGMAFVEIDGELVEYQLGPGQQIVVDTGNVAGFEVGVQIDIQQVPGIKNKLLGGEGLFNTVLTGPGKIWLQTMPISSVAASIRPFIPSGNASRAQRGQTPLQARKGAAEMRLMIASDIHGSAFYCRQMLEAYERERADRLLLLGDILYHGPRNDLPKEYAPKQVIALLNPMKEHLLCVRGNCDTEVDQMVLEFPVMAEYCLLELDGQSILATHGHNFNPEHLPALKGGDILLNGHTHVPACEEHETYIYMNPGSVSIPKEDSVHSYMIYENKLFQWKDMNGEVYRIWKTNMHC